MKRKTVVELTRASLLRGAGRATLLLVGLIMMLAVPAFADTIGISDGKLIVGTEPGDGNQVFAPTISGSDLVFANLDAAIVTPGCTGVGTTITCPLAGFQELVILGGDGDDVINLGGISGPSFPIIALGGPGDDVLIGTPGNDVKLFGGPGNDVIIIAAGNCFSKGTGLDVAVGGGCDAGPDPVFAPLSREAVLTPEPSAFWLLGSGLVGLIAVTSRRKLKTGK